VNAVPAQPAWLPTTRQVANGGIVLGLFAFFLTIPPISARSPLWPVLVGFCAIAAGLWAVTRGVRRPGWGAIAAGLVGITLGLLSTRANVSNLDQVVVWSALLSSTLVWATPLTFAAIGGMICERSGVVNIGLEGMMLAGAFFGALGADKFNSWELGLACAAVAGGGFALVHAVMAIHLRADQIISGFAINFLALGATGYFFIQIYGENGTPGDLPRIPDVNIDALGKVFGNLNLMIWLSFVLLIAAHITLFKTPIGLRIRSVGEHPRAADTLGISVYGTRYAAVVLSGILAALGGAYLSIGYLGSFSENMTAGRATSHSRQSSSATGARSGHSPPPCSSGPRLRSRSASPSRGGARRSFQALALRLTLIAVAGVISRSVHHAAAGRPTSSGRRRAWTALVVGLAGLLTLPAAIEVTRRSKRIDLLAAGYAIPLAFLLGLVSLVMARRAKRNLEWLQLREDGTGIATVAVVVGALAFCVAVAAALSVGFYGLVVVYQHSR
jgi:simple sugar transport system permease protein